MVTISSLLNEKKCTLNKEILDIKNGILLAIKTVQENLNNKGNDYFKDLDYYHELDKNGVLAYNRLINENIEDLKNICYHTNFNPFSPDRKFSFFGTNYTKTAINLRNKLETDIADKINFMNSKNIALEPIIPENISKFECKLEFKKNLSTFFDMTKKNFSNLNSVHEIEEMYNLYLEEINSFKQSKNYTYLNNEKLQIPWNINNRSNLENTYIKEKLLQSKSEVLWEKENGELDYFKKKLKECLTHDDRNKVLSSTIIAFIQLNEKMSQSIKISKENQKILDNYKYLCHSIINQQQYLLGTIDKLHSIKDEIDSQERKSYFSAIDKQDTVSLLSKNCSLNGFLNKSTDDTVNRENLNDYSFFSKD